MSVNLRAIHIPPAPARTAPERTSERDAAEPRADFASLLEQGTATTAGTSRRPGTATTPTVPTTSEGGGRSVADDGTSDRNLAAEGNEVTSRGTLSEDPRTLGMYVAPDFYHGTSYSPVFDQQNESGEWVATPRFEGQQIYSQWRGSKPDDWDPNARVEHDPLLQGQGPLFWKKDESGNWVKRETGYGGIPLNDDGKPMLTPNPALFPEYFVSAPDDDQEA